MKKAELLEELSVINSATPREFLEAAKHVVEEYHVSLQLSILEVESGERESETESPCVIDDLTEAVNHLRTIFEERRRGLREPIADSLAREQLTEKLAELKEATTGLEDKVSELARQFRSTSVHFSSDVSTEMEKLTTASEEALNVMDRLKTLEAERDAAMKMLMEKVEVDNAAFLEMIRAERARLATEEEQVR